MLVVPVVSQVSVCLWCLWCPRCLCACGAPGVCVLVVPMVLVVPQVSVCLWCPWCLWYPRCLCACGAHSSRGSTDKKPLPSGIRETMPLKRPTLTRDQSAPGNSECRTPLLRKLLWEVEVNYDPDGGCSVCGSGVCCGGRGS